MSKKKRKKRTARIAIREPSLPTELSPEQLAARTSLDRARGFFVIADEVGNVILDLSHGDPLMGDPVWGRKIAFAMLYASEIAHNTRIAMGSKKGYQSCEELFHCNCYFGLATDRHPAEEMGKCCFCDKVSPHMNSRSIESEIGTPIVETMTDEDT